MLTQSVTCQSSGQQQADAIGDVQGGTIEGASQRSVAPRQHDDLGIGRGDSVWNAPLNRVTKQRQSLAIRDVVDAHAQHGDRPHQTVTVECQPVAALVTGVGYIGAALLRRLAERHERIVAVENFYCTTREAVTRALPPQVELIEGDIAEPETVERALRAATSGSQELTVFHLAAQPSAAIALKQPEVTERTNLTGARLVLEAARDRGARVVFGGSFRVYGDACNGQIVDEDTPYGQVGDLSHLSKIYVEQLGRMLGGDFVSVRLGVVYGLSQIMKSDPPFMTVPNLFCQRAAQGEVLHVLEDRPLAFIHVDDAVSALLLAAHYEAPGWQVLNAAPEVATIGEIALTVQKLMQRRGGWVRVQGATSTEVTFNVRSRLDDVLTPSQTLASGLEAVLDYFRAAA